MGAMHEAMTGLLSLMKLIAAYQITYYSPFMYVASV